MRAVGNDLRERLSTRAAQKKKKVRGATIPSPELLGQKLRRRKRIARMSGGSMENLRHLVRRKERWGRRLQELGGGRQRNKRKERTRGETSFFAEGAKPGLALLGEKPKTVKQCIPAYPDRREASRRAFARESACSGPCTRGEHQLSTRGQLTRVAATLTQTPHTDRETLSKKKRGGSGQRSHDTRPRTTNKGATLAAKPERRGKC